MLAIVETLFVVRGDVANGTVGTYNNLPWREQSLFLALMLASL